MKFRDQNFEGYAIAVWMRIGDNSQSMHFPVEDADELCAMATAHDYIQRHKGHLSSAGLEVRAEVWRLHDVAGETRTGHPEQFVGAWLLSRHGSSMRVHVTYEYIPPTDFLAATEG